MKPKEKENKLQVQVRRANESIWIQGKIDVVPRKAFSVLIWNAMKQDFLKQDEFTIRRTELIELIGWDSTNKKKLRRALVTLTVTGVEFDIRAEKPSDSEYDATQLLGSVGVHKGQIVYTFSKMLKEKLLVPEFYTWLKIEQLKSFKSKHALALYEALKQCQNVEEKIESTGWISLSVFRKLMGCEGPYWNDFKQLNSKIILKALNQINTCSDIFARMERKKKGRRVTDIKFIIKQSKEPSLLGIQEQLQIDLHPEKDYRELAKTCWQKCFGNCGSVWSNHQDKEDECRYCQKFSQNVSES